MNKEPSMLLTSRDGEPVLLEGVRATGSLEDTLLSMTIEQRYRNTAKEHIEALYTFPLPWGSVLMGVEVVLGGKTLSGQVTARKQADQTYEQALSQGDAAILLERNRDGSHTLNLGNLAPGEDCVIRIRYTHSIGVEQGSVRLTLPTVMAPRFGNPAKAGLMPQQVPESDLMVEYPFELTVDVFGSLASARIASPSHPISVGPLRESAGAGVRIGLSRSAWLDRDVVLVLDQLQHESLGQATGDPFVPGQFAVKLALKPRVPQRASPLVLKVLVDCSGSMQGDSIASARRALQAIAQKLHEGDRFSLSRFGDRVLHRSRVLWGVTPATRLGAQRWISQLEANLGGTEMEDALASTFALESAQPTGPNATGTQPSQLADVLLVTDGEIYNVTETVALARASAHRVFVVGIGSAANHELIRDLAGATGGACEFVAPGEAVEPAVLRMFNRLRGGRLSELNLSWPDAIEPVWQQPLPLSVFDGDTVHVHAVFDQAVVGQVVLGADVDKAAQNLLDDRTTVAEVSLSSCEITEPSTASDDGISTLARMVAWARIEAMREVADDETARAPHDRISRITELAVTYQLVTDESSFVLVHERAQADKAADMPAQVKVRQMLAAGWSGTGSVNLSAEAADNSISYSRRNAETDAFDLPEVSAPAAWEGISRSRADVEYTNFFPVPSFSRKSPSSSGSNSHLSGLRFGFNSTDEPFDQEESQPLAGLWASDDVYEGMTPLGLSVWLSENPSDQWPVDSQGLAAIGLGQAVIDWIELLLGPNLLEQGDIENPVAVFVRWMGSEAVRIALNKIGGRTFAEVYERTAIRTPIATSEVFIDALLANALSKVEKRSWPDHFFLLEYDTF
jgi:Ca-activated chloride channel family protein